MEFVRTDHGDDTGVDPGFEALTRRLWRQRRLLDTLVFKLEVERLLLDAGQMRWIAAAAMEVGLVLDRIADEDLALELVLPAAEGAPRVRTLRELVGVAPAPWDHIFDDHHQALTEALAEATVLAADNADWFRPGELRLSRSDDDDGSICGYGGILDDLLTHRAQERAMEAALDASARVKLPALRRFLG